MPELNPESLPAFVDRLYRAAWALSGSSHEAEDLVQETFVHVLARPREIRDGDELAYLLGALRNTYLSSRRTAARRPRSAASIEDIELSDPRSGGRPELAVETHEVFRAIASLPNDFRLALVAVDVVGLSYREAADALGTREATITSRVYRARQSVVRAVSAGRPGRGVQGTREGLRPRGRLH